MGYGVYRRLPDVQLRTDDTAALHGGGAPPAPDDPPLSGNREQERFHAALRTYFMPPLLLGLAAPLFPAVPDEAPLTGNREQEAFHAAYRPPARLLQAPLFNPALFEAPPAADTPPLAGTDAQALFWAAQRPRLVVPPQPQAPFVDEFDLLFPIGLEQSAFHAAYRPPRPLPALLPVPLPAFIPQADEAPIASLAAQEAFHATYRRPFVQPGFRLLDPPLFPVVVPDSPPIPGLLAQEAFLAVQRPYPWRHWGGAALAPALFPVVIPDEPLPQLSPSTAAFWSAYRPRPWMAPAPPPLPADLLVALDCCEETLLRLDALDVAIADLSTAVSTGFADITTILSGIAADITILKTRRFEAPIDYTKALQEIKLLVLDLEKKLRRQAR